MRRLKYKTELVDGVKIALTKCDRGILIGTGDCMGCSYCYEHKPWDKIVMCRKKSKKK